MKRLLLIGMLLAGSGAVYAQKYLVDDADMKLKEACAKQQIDMMKLNEAWRNIQDAMASEKTVNYHETYKVASKIRNVQLVQLYDQGQRTGQLDTLKYFDGLKEILGYYYIYDRLIRTPNAKGKLPMKDNEIKAAHVLAQQEAAPIRLNMLRGGSSIIHSNTKNALEYLDTYLKSFDEPLFKEMKLNETDTLKTAGFLYYGMGLKDLAQTWEDTLKYLEYYEKTLETPAYAAYSCVELMNTYKKHGDMQNWEKYCKYALEHFPDDQQYAKLLIAQYMNDDRIDDAVKMCETMEKMFPKEIFPLETRALIVFNEKKYVESVELFTKLSELDPTYGRAWCSLGTSYYQLALKNSSNTKLRKEYLDKAIPAFKKAEEVAPDEPELWGYYLYHSYESLPTPDKVNMAKYKKYDTKK